MTHTVRLTAVWFPLLSAGIVLAQSPQPLPPAAPDGVEVLARGPVHEAFAGTAEQPVAGPVVPKAPPDPVEELPPDQKPPGDDVQWMPGYWQWDEERADFIWISGFWRQPPPGRVWVPGAWRQAPGGFQWVQGFWNGLAPQQPQQLQPPAEIEYLPPPPAPLELAPSVPAPTATCFYVPGVWQWHRARFAWRPGYWVEHRPNWVWVPSHYRWTPAGCVFIDGYWDRPLADRGLLFAPVAFRPAVLARPRFVYTPAYVVTDTSLYGSLFVRRGYGNYYFGDYYEPRYVTAGFSAWCGVSLKVGNFAVSVGRPAPVFDPLWSYYSVAYRHEPRWQANVTGLYTGRYNGDFARPPRTLVQQNTVVKNVTNITNITNVNTVNNNVMVTKLTDVRPATRAAAFQPVPQADRVREQQNARELRQLAVQRQKLETNLVDRGRTVARVTDAPQAVKLDLPKTATIRAQVPAAKAPPESPRPFSRKPEPLKTNPPPNPPADPPPLPPAVPKQSQPPPSKPPFAPPQVGQPPKPVDLPQPKRDRKPFTPASPAPPVQPPKQPFSQPKPFTPPPAPKPAVVAPVVQPPARKPFTPAPPVPPPAPAVQSPKPPMIEPPSRRPFNLPTQTTQPPSSQMRPPSSQVQQPKPSPFQPTAPRPTPKPKPKDKEKDQDKR